MHPLTKGALGVAVIAGLAAPVPNYEPAPARIAIPPSSASGAVQLKEPWHCPPRSLPVETGAGVSRCVTLPAVGARLDARTRRLAELPPSPAYLKMTAPTESVPRLPERPVHYGSYQLPVADVISVGSDLSPQQPGQPPKLGVRIITEPDAPVTLVDLEGETGRPEVVLVGELYGITVVVRHRVATEDADGSREYLVFYGELSRPGPNITSGAILSPMSVIGFVGDGEDDEPAVYYEVRRQEDALAGPAEHLTQLVSKSIAVDPRNVLPLAP